MRKPCLPRFWLAYDVEPPWPQKKIKKIIWLIGKALLARLWMAYQVGYRSTTTCIRVTTHIRFLMLISGVEPKPSPRRPAVLTWLSAVSCDTRRETSSLWRSKQAYTGVFSFFWPHKCDELIVHTCKWFINVSMDAVRSAPISYDLIEKFCLKTRPSWTIFPKPNGSISMSDLLGFQSSIIHCFSAAKKMVVIAARSMLQSGNWLMKVLGGGDDMSSSIFTPSAEEV